MKKTTYIFDLDGTLLDTLQDLAAAVNFALRKNGMEEHSIDDIRRFVGNGVRKLIERAVPDGSKNPRIDEVFADFRSYYMQHSLDATKPYDGITGILQELKQRGCKMAVVSNKMMAATQELVAHFFPEIEVAIGENEAEGIRKKPAPDMVLTDWAQKPSRQSISVTAMWTFRQPRMLAYLVSAYCGDFATGNSCLNMVLSVS